MTRSPDRIGTKTTLELEHKLLADAQALAEIGSWVLDLQEGTVVWSDEIYRILGVPIQDATSKVFDDRVHPDDREGVTAAFADAIANHTRYVFDHRIVTPDGVLKWVHVRGQISYDEDGKPVHVVGTTQNITERKMSEAALQHSQQLLRLATRIGAIGGWDVDLATSMVAWSDEVCAIYGVPPGYHPTVDEAIGFYAPEHRGRMNQAVAACVGEGTPFDLELEIVNARNERVWVRAIGEAELDRFGRVSGVRGAFQNISERKIADAALRKSDERFRFVAQATSDVIWDWDLDSDFCWWSDGLHTQFGHDDGSPRPIDFWARNIHPQDRQRVLDHIHLSIDSSDFWSDQYRFRKGDGTYIQVSDRAVIARDGQGVAYRVLGAMVDITQQRQLEAQVEQMRRVSSLGQLAANMAHEFNNVLMGIQTFVEVIRRATTGVPKAQDATSRIIQSVGRGKKITDQILRFTRQSEPVLQPIDVRSWLLAFAPEAVSLAGDALRVEVVPPHEALEVEGDPEQLQEMLANLVINAREASAPGGRLVIAAAIEDESSFIDITVRDFGSGMDTATLQHIFEPLFTTKKRGTGLGLTISHGIVTKHGGKITVESLRGEGTTFHVLLPSKRAIGSEQSPSSIPRRTTLPKTILIIEDEDVVAAGISMLLAAEGVMCTTVFRGAEAVEAIARDAPELVLLDIGLPDINGVEVFAQIDDRWPGLPVILMSGHFGRSDLESILALPHVGFLQKPFGIEELLSALDRHHSPARQSLRAETAGSEESRNVDALAGRAK